MLTRFARVAALLIALQLSASNVEAQFAQFGAKFVGTGGATSAQGQAISISGDGRTGIVGGNQDNSNVGAAWIFVRSGSGWGQVGAKLVGTGASGSSQMGLAVAMSADGNTALVGGPGDTGGGGTWVFVRSGNTWTQQGSKLLGTGGVGLVAQGSAVALSADGNTAIIGGPSDNSFAGAVWVFTRDGGGNWSQQGSKLVGTGGTAARQGSAVALSADGNTAIVGGNMDNASVGASWVFTRSGGVWTQQGNKLLGSDAVGPARQGYSVALSADGNTALVGGFQDNVNQGAAWVYVRNGGVWTQQGFKLFGSGASAVSTQGASVSLSGDGNTAMVGATGEGNGVGGVWFFARSGGAWYQPNSRLVGSAPVGASAQGIAVALSADGTTAVEGGRGDNLATGATWGFLRASPTIVSVKDVPNDQGGKVSLRWNASPFDLPSSTAVGAYWIWRQVPFTSGASLLPSGVDANSSQSRSGTSLRTIVEGTQTSYWEYVGQQTAQGLPGYSYTVATLSDSVPGSNPRTLFMVEAAAATGEFWASLPDSGYSVDNLPPGPPAPVAAAYSPSSDVTHLHWGMSPELDVTLYRIYRGSSAGFVPGLGNLLSSQPDTGYADPGAAGSYYKLSAVDAHGNESGFALITPQTTAGAPGGSMPGEVSLARVAPNPLHGEGVFHYALPRDASTSLAIYDATGRLVRQLVRGIQPAGTHSVEWDGRDASGKMTAGGVYFLRLATSGRSLASRFVRMN